MVNVCKLWLDGTYRTSSGENSCLTGWVGSCMLYVCTYVHIVGSIYNTIALDFRAGRQWPDKIIIVFFVVEKLGRKVLSALGSPYAVGTYLLSEWLVTKKVWQLAAYLT